MIARPKIPAIYNTVQNWYTNDGTIHYIAHAITMGWAAVPLGAEQAIGAGGGPQGHPDQVFWQQGGFANTIAAAGGVAGIRRVEIDCTLMPCTAGANCCLFRVPYLIRQTGLLAKPLRIFSHRDEGMGGANTSSKRCFYCQSSDANAQLTIAYNGNDGWHWAPWGGNYNY